MPRVHSRPSPPMLRLAVAIGLVIVLAPIITPVIAPAPARAATHSVQIQDSTFGPEMLTVSVGDTVTWTNADDRPHTVTSDAGLFDSANLDPGQTFSFTFTTAGSFSYMCSYHDEMRGLITVEAAAPAVPATVAPAAPEGDAQTAAGSGEDEQPDTALPFTDGEPPWLAIPLIGLGLVAIAIAVVPGTRAFVRVSSADRPRGGWRR